VCSRESPSWLRISLLPFVLQENDLVKEGQPLQTISHSYCGHSQHHLRQQEQRVRESEGEREIT
jgi:hypothetical protein